jgi:hypothetical protein
MLPQLNVNGGRRRAVNDAVAVVNATPDPAHLIRQSADAATRIRDIGIKEGQTYMFALPPHFRLALEMVLHQHDERRAMDGELRELEQRWRDAEAIAAIADSLTLPPDIDERLDELRGTALDGGTR